uniref:Uncharacterized protein n=1 Tax=viral metagenome TaxID=1070528 RepID=A0A6M3IJH2_9ZZZZ
MILAALALGTGWLVGCHEGMVHVKPIDEMHRYSYPTEYSDWFVWESLVRQFNLGVRGHVWANRYHAITTGMRAGILFLGIMLARTHSWEPWALVLSLGWLSYEPSYEYARYGTMMDRRYKEHVNFGDIRIVIPWRIECKDCSINDPLDVRFNECIENDCTQWGWKQIHPLYADKRIMTAIRVALVAMVIGVMV